MEDDNVVNLVMAKLEKEAEPDPRRIQINLTGFLDRNASQFALDLWKLLLSAQENYQPGRKGIPDEMIKEKMEEFSRINEVSSMAPDVYNRRAISFETICRNCAIEHSKLLLDTYDRGMKRTMMVLLWRARRGGETKI